MTANINEKSPDEVVQIAAALLREGSNFEAIAFLRAQESLSTRGLDYLCDAYFQSRDWENAYETIRRLIVGGTDTPKNRKLEAKILSNWGRHAEALSRIREYVQDGGGDVEAMVIAKVCSHNLGDQVSAQQYGQQALTLKDRASTAATKPFPMRPNKTGRRIISLSVWGANKAYLLGAAINIQLARKHFPGWIVRMYVSSSVDAGILDLYSRLGAEVVLADLQFPEVPTYFWRFLVADDQTTEYFLCRDADCRISAEEATLVNEWIVSKKRFHVARDHVLHDDLILAGMWGGVGTPDLKMRQLIATYFSGKPTNKYGHDQIFLGKMVWPLIRQHVFVHDRYYWTAGVKSHKHKQAFNFGEGFMDEEAVTAEAITHGLIEQ